jgi:hypothetical protein
VRMKITAGLFVAASVAAFAQAPAGSSATQRPAAPSGQATPSQGAAQQGEQTLTGCLTSADNIYTLTVMDDSGAPGTTATTTAYTLAPGSSVDLQPHVNKRVTVKGTDAGPGMANSARVVESTPAAPAATGTSGTAGSGSNGAAGANNDANRSGSTGGTPTVQTTSKARINAKTLNVTNVQPASGNCGA